MKKIFRIEIQSKLCDKPFRFWIGKNLSLETSRENAIPCTEEDSLCVMETIDIEATCFVETKEAPQ